MASPIDKSGGTSDTTAERLAPKAVEQHTNLLDLVDSAKKTYVAPFVNDFAVAPVNTVLNVVNGGSDAATWALNKVSGKELAPLEVPKLPEMEVSHAKEGTFTAYAQGAVEVASSFLVYAVAGKLASSGLRSAVRLAPAELAVGELQVGSALRGVAQDSRVANVLGATAYAGLKDTHDGESHLSNAASTFVGFSFFEAGNSKFVSTGGSMLERFGQRYAVGSVGGIAQANVASLIQENKFADRDATAAAALSGGLLNAILPAGRHIADRAVENPLVGKKPFVNDAATRLHADAVRSLPAGVAPEAGSWADPAAVKAINKAAAFDPSTRLVVDDPHPTRINQKENVVYREQGDDPLRVLQELAHREINADPAYEQQFKSHAEKIVSADPVDPRNSLAREGYITTRISQEVGARVRQNKAAEDLGATNRASVDATEILNTEGYRARFEKEADDFVATMGKSRPTIDYAGDAYQYKSEFAKGVQTESFLNFHERGRTSTDYTQNIKNADGTITDQSVVKFGYQNNAIIKIEFGQGREHSVHLGEAIEHVRVVNNGSGTVKYYFNGRHGEPQLTLTPEYQELKLLPMNGDRVVITAIDGEGLDFDFADKSKLSVGTDGRMLLQKPGKAARTVELGDASSRLAVVERADGSKLIQLANADARKRVELRDVPDPGTVVKPRPAPAAVPPRPRASARVERPADDDWNKEIPPREPRAVPRELRQPSVQGGHIQPSAGHDVFDNGFGGRSHEEEDRYPFQPNFYQDPAHVLTGVDQRSGLDLSDPQQVAIGQMHLYGPLENHFAHLGRHDTEEDNNRFPW